MQRHKKRVTAETDLLASKIAADFRKSAQDKDEGQVAADLMRKAADSMPESQTAWKIYREKHCQTVEYTWTTGSGAGTAHEICLFVLQSNACTISDPRSKAGAGTKIL